MNELKIMRMVGSFPIGEVSRTREELLSKASVVSYLARFQEQFAGIDNTDEIEFAVRSFFADTLALSEGEEIPSLALAESTLHLSSGFLQDFGKIQYVKETQPTFSQTFDVLAQSMDMESLNSKTR